MTGLMVFWVAFYFLIGGLITANAIGFAINETKLTWYQLALKGLLVAVIWPFAVAYSLGKKRWEDSQGEVKSG